MAGFPPLQILHGGAKTGLAAGDREWAAITKTCEVKQKMAYAGGSLGPRIVTVFRMPTAIVRAYADEGFVIAADGRYCEYCESPSLPVISDTTQKIFPIARSVCYCVRGIIRLGDKTEDVLDTVLFDFLDEISQHLQSRSINRDRSLIDYVGKICRQVYRNLQIACRNPRIDMPIGLNVSGRGEEILNVWFDGYMGGRPERVSVRFWHENNSVREPEITQEPLLVDPWRYGSQAVADRLISDHAFRQKYEDAFRQKYDLPVAYYGANISSLMKQAVTFIEACSGPEGATMDPICRTIGGHIHMAAITPREGFAWVPGFEPIP